MPSSRAAIFHGTGRPFELTEVPVPAPGPGEILVRNELTTLCRSDLNTFEGKRTEKTPTILGHEIVGRIVSFGEGAPWVDARGQPLHAGDRITWAIYAADPDCELARRGIPQKGEGLFKYGHEQVTADSHLHGGLADYCLLRQHTPLVKVDESVAAPTAALINCSIATAAGAWRLAGDLQGRGVLVTGAGMLGVIGAAMCRRAGAELVVAADRSEERLAMAQRFGAHETIVVGDVGNDWRSLWETRFGGRKPDVALDFSGAPDCMEASLDLLGIGGVAVWIGASFPQRDLAVNAESVLRRLLTIRGLHNYHAGDLVSAVEFVERCHLELPFEELIADVFPLERVNEAFFAATGTSAFRIGIQLDDR
jgi:putative phosphonate catabolism associated alcohol dehydrogenase